jgi:SGNH hydrolase-like domain, acetyltransferase AlgX
MFPIRDHGTSTPVSLVPLDGRARLVAAALMVCGYALLHESFEPFESRASLQGSSASHTIGTNRREPLFLEFELVLHVDGPERPDVVARVNGRVVSRIRAAAFATERRHVAIPLAALGDQSTRVAFAVDPPTPGAAFELRLRLHNYFGIAPDFPRAAVVADEALWHRWRQRSMTGHAVAMGLLLLACAATTAGVARAVVLTGASDRWTWALVVGPALVLGYSFASPLHVWLSAPALAVVTLVPWAVGLGLRHLARVRRRLAPTLAAALVALASLEAALRLFNAVRPSFVFYADDYNRYRGRPGAPHFDAVFNSRGFNDVERPYGRLPGISRRIVAIGDSFAVGVVPRPDNFLALLERTLSRQRPTDVINLGVSGTAPPDYLALLVDEGLAYRPDLVLVTFYVGNDFETRARRIYEYSFVATLARAAWRLGTPSVAPAATGDAGATYLDDQPTLPRARFLEIGVDRSWVFARDDPRLDAAVGRVADALARMRDLSERAGAGLLVAIVPDEIQVDGALLTEVAAARGVGRDAYDLERPNRVLAAALTIRGVETLDLLPAFRARATEERLYKPQDTHWNRAGNRLAAEEIGRALLR